MSDKEKEIVIGPHDSAFGMVLNCAVRYCIGRRTYAPETVTDWIRENCEGMLDRRTIETMMRDIDGPPVDSLGDDCDIRTWMDFRAWLETSAGAEIEDAGGPDDRPGKRRRKPRTSRRQRVVCVPPRTPDLDECTEIIARAYSDYCPNDC